MLWLNICISILSSNFDSFLAQTVFFKKQLNLSHHYYKLFNHWKTDYFNWLLTDPISFPLPKCDIYAINNANLTFL